MWLMDRSPQRQRRARSDAPYRPFESADTRRARARRAGQRQSAVKILCVFALKNFRVVRVFRGLFLFKNQFISLCGDFNPTTWRAESRRALPGGVVTPPAEFIEGDFTELDS